MISFNTVDYRSSIQPVMKVIKSAAYNTIFSKRKPARNSAKGRKRILCQLLKETENSPVKCES